MTTPDTVYFFVYLQKLNNFENIRSIIEFNQNKLANLKTREEVLYSPNSNFYKALTHYLNKPNINIRD